MRKGMEVLLQNLKPTSSEQRRARRRALALESMARFGRGSVLLQYNRVLFEDEKMLKEQSVAVRLREHRKQ